MITLGIGELVTVVRSDVPDLLRRRGRREHQPDDRPQPVRAELRRRPSRSTTSSWPGRRSRSTLMLLLTRTPLGRMANAVPRQLRARPVRGLRPAHGPLLPVRALRLLRRHRGRAYALTYEIVTFDTVAGAMSRQRAAHDLHRRRRRLRRPGDRRRADRAAAELGEPALQLLARLRGRPLHPDGDVRAGRHRRPRDDAPADLAAPVGSGASPSPI